MSFKSKGKLTACAGCQPNAHLAPAARILAPIRTDGDDRVFAVGSALNNQLARVQLVYIDERYIGLLGRKPRHQCRYVIRPPGCGILLHKHQNPIDHESI